MLVQVPPRRIVTDVPSESVSPELQFKPSAPDLQFKVFSKLWAIATLFHLAHSSIFDVQLNLALLTLSAFYLIFRPSLYAFLFLVVFQTFDAVFRMPITTNHWVFTAFVNLTILQCLLFLMMRNRTFFVGGGDLFKTFAPVVRIEVIILYAFAVFHKLNSDFFNPAASCATDLLKAQHLDALIVPDERLFTANAYLTLLVECLIPLLLCFRKTVNVGVLLGLVFHCVLSFSSYNAFFDFSSMLFALYFLFLNPVFSVKLYEIPARLRRRIQPFLTHFSVRKLLYVITAVAVFLGVIYLLTKKLNTFHSVHLYFFWTVFSLVCTWSFIRIIFLSRQEARPAQPMFRIANGAMIVIPLLVFLNGTSPYLGLKTENSYAMFSNLKTEGGTSNHFLVPADIQLFDYQKDVVEIVSSTDPFLAELAAANKALVLFEFRNYVHERKPEMVEYLLNGDRQTFTKGDKVATAALGRNPYVLAKLMKFRPFSPSNAQTCEH